METKKAARALGWFSIGLGLTQVLIRLGWGTSPALGINGASCV